MTASHQRAGGEGRVQFGRRLAEGAAAVALGLAVVVTAGPANADVYAYASTSPYDDGGEFGIVDLNNGTFVQLGSINDGHIGGLAIGPDNVLYASGEYTPDLWTVNPSNGATTLIGVMDTMGGAEEQSMGSTTSAFYLTDRAGNFYQVNLSDGALRSIAYSGAIGLSSNSATLYGQIGPGTLYTIDPATGAATLIGTSVISGDWEVIAEIDGVLYGSPYRLGGLYTIDPTDAVATYVGGSEEFWGLAAESYPSSEAPEPATWALLLAGLVGLGAIRSRIRT